MSLLLSVFQPNCSLYLHLQVDPLFNAIPMPLSDVNAPGIILAQGKLLTYLRCHYHYYCMVFRLDALALSVIATATWLAGWVAGWLSHSGIVSKPLNLSENFFNHLKAPSL